jgi:hypothetical protein
MKLCKECKHAQAGGYQRPTNLIAVGRLVPWICTHPDSLEPVEGRAKALCEVQRRPGAACGPDGERWEEGEPAPLPEPVRLAPAEEPATPPRREPWWKGFLARHPVLVGITVALWLIVLGKTLAGGG